MPVDSPSEYVAKLEAEVRALRTERYSLQDRVSYLETKLKWTEEELKTSDELRAAVIDGATSAARVTETAIGRLERSEKIVEAAYAVMRACIRGDKDDGGKACDRLVNAVLEHQKGQPS